MEMNDPVDCPCMDNVVFGDCCVCCEYWECYEDEEGTPRGEKNV